MRKLESTDDGWDTGDGGNGRPAPTGRPVRALCRLAAVQPMPGMLGALQNSIGAELPEFAFCIHPREDVSVVWLCGYVASRSDAIRSLRREHPEARIVVTGQKPLSDWSAEALVAGADLALEWPVELGGLRQALAPARRRTPA